MATPIKGKAGQWLSVAVSFACAMKDNGTGLTYLVDTGDV